ncbi:hypothetical protein G9A89_013006 [Geosiphon pyriformis]|nr:hypothetical protein G9A89_013006 [Geosiphon pyriformis]
MFTTINNKFKVAITPDTATLEYYQSIYTCCKQKFNIPDGIEVVKKSVYQYIENRINNYLFENYNISEVRSNLYNNLVHYSRLGTEDPNSETLATYFQELNFNIIKYCEKKYPVQSQYSIDFELETETNNKDKQRLKQYSKTTPNTPILQKTTAKHLQTSEQETSVKLPLSITPFPISFVQPQTPNLLLNHFSRPEDFQSPRNLTQQQEPISTSANIIDYLQENQNNHSESLESKKTESEPKEITKNEEEITTAYIAKIPEFTGEDNDTSPQEWLDKVQKAGDANEEPFENWQAFKDAFLQQFTDNNTSITLRNCFHNIKQETSETVMTYLGRFNKLLRQIRQLETNDYYSDAQILDQFIAGLKDKLIKKVCPHTSADLATAIRHAKSYEIAIEEANHTKLVNLTIGKTSSAAEEKIDQLTKKILTPTTMQPKQFWITIQQPTSKLSLLWNFRTLETRLSNQHYSSPQQSYYQSLPPIYYSPRPQNQNSYYPLTPQLMQQQYQQFLPIQPYQVPARRLNNNNNRINPNNQLVPQNSGQQRPNHYHTQPSYLTIPEESDFQQTALFEDEVVAPRSNSFNHTILPAQIAQNANLSDIFSFEFEANESPFLLSNAAVNEQKAITAIYTEATVEGKPIRLILDSGLAGSIITYQLMQQLKQNVDRPAQTVIVTADGIKKTLVGKIDDFPFIIDGIIIPVKVLVIDAPQYQALVGNDWLLKANTNLNWETQELKILYQGQYTIISATCSTFNKQSEKTPVFEFKEEKKMLLTETYMALGSPSNWAEETEQEIFEESKGWKKNHHIFHSNAKIATKNFHQWEPVFSQKKNTKLALDKTPCLTCRKMLPEECNWIDVAIKGGVCDQTCQYALSISEKVRRGTPFDAAYNNIHQMKEAEYIEYTMELAGFDYEDESLTKINLKIALEILPGAMVQIASRSLLASKKINIRGEVIDAGYTGDIIIMLQNETDKTFKIKHAEKIAQAIYLPLINILGLQSVNNREQLGKSEKGTQANYHLSFGEHHEIYTCSKPTTTQQIFESNEQICLKHEISIPNVYIPKGMKKFRVTFYNPNNYSIVLLNKLEIGIIHSNIFQDENSQIVSNFIEIVRHTLFPNPNIIPIIKNYHFLEEKLSRINMAPLEPQQQRQLKQLIAEFADIFAKDNNDLGKTDIVQHQIHTGNAPPK